MLSVIARFIGRSAVGAAKRHTDVFSKVLKESRPCLVVYALRNYSAPKSHTDVRDLTKEEWAKRLTPEQFSVCREQCTEEPFSGIYNTMYDPGMYSCVCCGVELFSSEAKYDSGTGWPSFYQPYTPDDSSSSNIIERPENSADIATFRTEVICKKCDSHLGHVFDDGPEPTGKRYCLNSVALKFTPKK